MRALAVVQGLLIPQFARAAETAPSSVPATKKGDAPIDEAKKTEAAHRFDRALRLFDSGDNAGALAEFKRAYELLPQPVVLYNIGLVYATMSRPVDAADALEQVVNDPRLSTDQGERARRTLQEQQARIGRLTVTTKPEKAHVDVDGIEVAQTPLVAPIRISEGNHIVGVMAEGYAPTRKEILIAGNADVALNFELSLVRSAQVANLSVRSRIRDAELFVDGHLVGRTPLSTSVALAAGHHSVELRRPGYVTARRELDVGEGAVGELALDLMIDQSVLGAEGGTLALDAGESGVEVAVDGERRGLYSAPLLLPRGSHHIAVTAPGFLPLERDVSLEANRTNTVPVVLEPTAETRRSYRSSALFHRTWGWVGIIGGAAIAGGSAVLAVIETSRKSDAQSQLNAINAKYDNNEPPCDYLAAFGAEQGSSSLCNKTIGDASSRVDSAQAKQTIGYVGIGIGGSLAVTGLVLLLTGNPPDKYTNAHSKDSATEPRFSLTPGPGNFGTGLRMAF